MGLMPRFLVRGIAPLDYAILTVGRWGVPVLLESFAQPCRRCAASPCITSLPTVGRWGFAPFPFDATVVSVLRRYIQSPYPVG